MSPRVIWWTVPLAGPIGFAAGLVFARTVHHRLGHVRATLVVSNRRRLHEASGR